MLGIEELSEEDRGTVQRARRLIRFLTQPFHTTEHFTGKKGATVPLAQTLQGCQEILEGKHDEKAEGEFYMIGALEETRNAERGIPGDETVASSDLRQRTKRSDRL